MNTGSKVWIPLHLDDMCCDQHDPEGLADEKIEVTVTQAPAFDEACDDVMIEVTSLDGDVNYLPVSLVTA